MGTSDVLTRRSATTMMFFILASLFGLLAAAPMDPTMAPVSRSCCMPHKFSATLIQLTATLPPQSMDPKIVDSYSVMDYDFDMKMLRLQMNQRDQNTGMMTMIDVYEDYTNMKNYSVVAGQCYVTPSAAPMTEPCVQSNMTYAGSHMIGSGANAMRVEGWMMTAMGMRTMMMIQPDTCTPISMNVYGDVMDGSKQMSTFTFADIMKNQYSTMDKSPFTMPDSCKNPVMPQAPAVGK